MIFRIGKKLYAFKDSIAVGHGGFFKLGLSPLRDCRIGVHILFENPLDDDDRQC